MRPIAKTASGSDPIVSASYFDSKSLSSPLAHTNSLSTEPSTALSIDIRGPSPRASLEREHPERQRRERSSPSTLPPYSSQSLPALSALASVASADTSQLRYVVINDDFKRKIRVDVLRKRDEDRHRLF